jgi:hypothetical protein
MELINGHSVDSRLSVTNNVPLSDYIRENRIVKRESVLFSPVLRVVIDVMHIQNKLTSLADGSHGVFKKFPRRSH